ncbi:MAG: type II toxin-antitoxin system VapC family toxin [Thermoanaerobaculales bacterium]|nr:type II toxin-antitoxin system VapC family toxin [Thermoanaerobaculales bacterium]
MRYLLDTNACIRLLNGSSAGVVERLEGCDPSEVAMSAVVRAELVFGARKSTHVAENLRLVDALFEPFVCLPFDDRAADAYGSVRADLERAGRPIGPNDLLIAATALAHDLTLVTHNMSEFGRVPGLRVDDWEA